MFNIVIIGQSGRLQAEALLLAASLRQSDPGFSGQLIVAMPEPGPLWDHDPRITDPATLAALHDMGATILTFPSRHFGQTYPIGNKIEVLSHLPDAPFLFLDTDTLVTGPLSALPLGQRPTASLNRSDTWPESQPYLSAEAIWRSLYTRFGLDFETSLDPGQPPGYWQRHLYFNAGWFTAPSPHGFGATFLRFAAEIAADPGPALACQSLDPWLDQIALPLAIHAHGGGRPGPDLSAMDSTATCHWRTLPLLYARGDDATIDLLESLCHRPDLRPLLEPFAPFRRMVFKAEGATVRALFDRDDLPRKEQAIRNAIKRAGLWVR